MGIVYVMGKWSLLLFSFCLGSCLFITLIFSLMKAGKRADEGEEKILEIISPAHSSTNAESTTVQVTEVSLAE